MKIFLSFISLVLSLSSAGAMPDGAAAADASEAASQLSYPRLSFSLSDAPSLSREDLTPFARYKILKADAPSIECYSFPLVPLGDGVYLAKSILARFIKNLHTIKKLQEYQCSPTESYDTLNQLSIKDGGGYDVMYLRFNDDSFIPSFPLVPLATEADLISLLTNFRPDPETPSTLQEMAVPLLPWLIRSIRSLKEEVAVPLPEKPSLEPSAWHLLWQHGGKDHATVATYLQAVPGIPSRGIFLAPSKSVASLKKLCNKSLGTKLGIQSGTFASGVAEILAYQPADQKDPSQPFTLMLLELTQDIPPSFPTLFSDAVKRIQNEKGSPYGIASSGIYAYDAQAPHKIWQTSVLLRFEEVAAFASQHGHKGNPDQVFLGKLFRYHHLKKKSPEEDVFFDPAARGSLFFLKGSPFILLGILQDLSFGTDYVEEPPKDKDGQPIITPDTKVWIKGQPHFSLPSLPWLLALEETTRILAKEGSELFSNAMPWLKGDAVGTLMFPFEGPAKPYVMHKRLWAPDTTFVNLLIEWGAKNPLPKEPKQKEQKEQKEQKKKKKK